MPSIFGNDVALMVDNCFIIDESRSRPAIASQQTRNSAQRGNLRRLISKDYIAVGAYERECVMVIREKHGIGHILQNDAMHTFCVKQRLPLPLTLFEGSSQCAHFNIELLAKSWIVRPANKDIVTLISELARRNF
jgi:hypothetical protein